MGSFWEPVHSVYMFGSDSTWFGTDKKENCKKIVW